jgi:hypothetical protein
MTDEAESAFQDGQKDARIQIRAAIRTQIAWAKDRLCEAQRDDDVKAGEAWHGYIQGLQWVLEIPLQGGRTC